MKNRFGFTIYFLILINFISCQKKNPIEGNFSTCLNGEYGEVYFKKDSMRVASDFNSDYLSEWRKFEAKDDTLQFETFGEWRQTTKAEIKYIGVNKIKLKFLKDNENTYLKKFDENLNFKNINEFWSKYNNRKNSSNCKKKYYL